MYRVLIVDDEPEIRQGLRLKADWAGLNLSVIGEAGNGMEAMERLACEAVDIVITDMNMPVMNGVSFLEDCRRLYPELKLIVITGYEDFHYARAAVRNQARDYLLKPVAADELMAVLQKVKEELDRERNDRDQQAVIQWRLSQYYMEMKEHFLVQLVKEDVEQVDALKERAALFELGEWDLTGIHVATAGLRERTGRLRSCLSVRPACCACRLNCWAGNSRAGTAAAAWCSAIRTTPDWFTIFCGRV